MVQTSPELRPTVAQVQVEINAISATFQKTLIPLSPVAKDLFLPKEEDLFSHTFTFNEPVRFKLSNTTDAPFKLPDLKFEEDLFTLPLPMSFPSRNSLNSQSFQSNHNLATMSNSSSSDSLSSEMIRVPFSPELFSALSKIISDSMPSSSHKGEERAKVLQFRRTPSDEKMMSSLEALKNLLQVMNSKSADDLKISDLIDVGKVLVKAMSDCYALKKENSYRAMLEKCSEMVNNELKKTPEYEEANQLKQAFDNLKKGKSANQKPRKK